VAAGLVRQETADLLRQTQPHYNPTRFIQADQALQGAGSGNILVNDSTLRRLTEIGHEGNSVRPIGSFAQAIADGELAIQKNVLGQQIIDTLVADPTFGPKMRRAPADMVTGPITRLDKAADGIATVATHLYGDPRRGIMRIMRNGTPEYWQLPEDKLLRDAIADLNLEQMATMQKLFSAAQEITRAGATYASPSFMPINIVADAISASIREGPDVVARYPRALREIVSRGPAWQEAMRAGMGGSGIMGRSGEEMVRGVMERSPEELVRMVRNAGGIPVHDARDVLNLLRGSWADALGGLVGGALTASQTPEDDPNRALKILGGAAAGASVRRPLLRANDIVEQTPRLATFMKRRGMGETADQAALAGRQVTVDFSRMGNAVRWLRPLTLFLPAQVGGAAAPFRALRDPNVPRVALGGRNVPVSAFGMAGMTLAGLGVWMWNHQFPEQYNDIPEWAKHSGGFVSIVNPFGWVKAKNEVGYENANFFTIPIREYQAWGIGPLTIALDAMDKRDPGKLVDGLKDVFSGYLPAATRGVSAFPSWARVPFELRSGYSSFTGRPITPRSQEGLPYSERTTPRTAAFSTSSLGRAVATSPVGSALAGRTEGLSPIETDYAVRGFAAGAGQTALDLTNQMAGRPSNNPNEVPVASGLLRGLWRSYGGATRDDLYDKFEAAVRQEEPGAIARVKAMPEYQRAERPVQESMLKTAADELRDQMAVRFGIPSAAAQRDAVRYTRLRTGDPAIDKVPLPEILLGATEYERGMALAKKGTNPGFSREQWQYLERMHAYKKAILVPNEPQRQQSRQDQLVRDRIRAELSGQLYGR
jgi:hypothetical protein